MKLIVLVLLAVAAVPTSAHARPFPSGPDFRFFSTPSGRIVCGYGGGGVDCTNFERGETTAGELGQRLWRVNRTGRGKTVVVNANAPSEAPRARYGVIYTYRTITCVVHRKTGITCRNRRKHGFTVSVERQRIF